jgi:hypothetical protein
MYANVFCLALNPDKFDVRYVWLCTLFNFIGGGPIGYEAMQYTVANSITTESNRQVFLVKKGEIRKQIANLKFAEQPSSSTSLHSKSSTSSSLGL